MALDYPISATQTDAKSPVDEQLMDDIRLNLEAIKAAANTTGAFDYQWKVNGFLSSIPSDRRKRIDGVLVSKASTLQQCRVYLEEPGTGGTLQVDVRKYTKPDTIVTALQRQFSSTINSIARAGSAVNTQSVTRSTAQISTQSITQWKSSINISSIVLMGDDLVRYNLASAPDSGWIVGDSVAFASCSNAANDGTFVIVRLRDDGGNNVVVTNVSGVAQSGVAGTTTLKAYSYNFTNPVSTEFSAGEIATFASHSTGGNNGALTVYAINQSGNNIIVKNASGATQGGAAGTADTNRWIFAFSASAASDYVVGEKALTASHTAGGNDGSLTITAVNQGGNNVILYNPSGVVQGGAVGNVNTQRWVYFFSSDPSAQVSVGYTVIVDGATTPANDAEYVVKQVNRSTSDNVVVYTTTGVAQGGSGGTLFTKRILVKFGSDQSATITTDSKITLYGTSDETMDDTFSVIQVNRGGGSNYNAVVESSDGVEQLGAGGRVIFESKSVFDTLPSIVIPDRETDFALTHGQISSNAVFNATRSIIAANTLVMFDILSIPDGRPKNITVQLL